MAALLNWTATTDTVEERLQAALAAAATLYAKKLPEEQETLPPPDDSAGSELIGLAARARYSALPALETRPDAPLLRPDGRPRQLANEIQDAHARTPARSPGDRREVYGLVGRMGEGGRQVSDRRAALTSVTQALLDQLGEPVEYRTVAGDVIVMRWLVDPDGDSAWFARQSPTSQAKAEETAMDQIRESQTQEDERLLKPPRWIVVTLNNSGERKPHERYDLMLAREWINEGWLKTIVFRNEKRLARQQFTLAWCAEVFARTQTGVYFTERRRLVDWEYPGDRVLFTINSMMASEDRIAINKQTQAGIDKLYTDEGKGWPGLQKVGLMRDPLSGFMIECEAQTEMLVRGARTYASMSGVKSGIKQMADRMRDEFGFELSAKQWERVLKEDGYTTGEFFFNRKGRGRVALLPIQLVNPIPAELAQRIREALATNKGNRRSRPGDFVLLRAGAGQAIPAEDRGVFCARCGLKLGAWLQGGLGDTRYRHPSPVPACCRGWGGVERGDIEGRIMPELWRLASVPELYEAAVRAAAAEDVRVSADLSPVQRRQVQREIDDLSREIARLGREYRRLYLHKGKAAHTRKNHFAAYDELVGGLREDKRQLEARLSDADIYDAVEQVILPAPTTALAEALRKVLTVDVPAGDAACRRRAAVYGRFVSKVLIDKHDDGNYDVQLYGPLVPRDLPLLAVPLPTEYARVELTAVIEEDVRARSEATSDLPPAYGDARADMARRPELQVSSEGAPYDETCKTRHAWTSQLAA